MNARELKTEALCWLRFVKKMETVATEVGRWNADVIGMTPDISIEVEVKTSVADLRAEFRNKTAKHFVYAQGTGPFTPNYFYVLVVPALADQALAILTEKAPKAGLIVFRPELDTKAGRRIEVIKRAQKLHDKAPGNKYGREVLLRMGSELCARYLVAADFHTQVLERIDALNAAMLDRIEGVIQEEPACDAQ